MHWSAVKKSGIVYLKPWTQFRICINKEKMCTILLYYINHKIIRERIYICPCVLEPVQKVYIWSCVQETVQKVYMFLCSRNSSASLYILVFTKTVQKVYMLLCSRNMLLCSINSSESVYVLVFKKQFRKCMYMSLFLWKQFRKWIYPYVQETVQKVYILVFKEKFRKCISSCSRNSSESLCPCVQETVL